MRTIYLIITLLLTELFFTNAQGQISRRYTIPLKKRIIAPDAELDAGVIARINKSVLEEPLVTILQLSDLPTDQQKKALLWNGIHLLNYLGGYAYLVSIDKPLKTDALIKIKPRSILLLEPDDKISSSLQGVVTDTTVHASIFSFIDVDDAISRLREKGFGARKVYGDYPILQIHVPFGRLNELASLGFIEYVEPPPPPFMPLNYENESGTRVNVLHSPNYNLNGEGITFLVNEVTGYPQDHIDFLDRSIENRTVSPGSYHSTHIHGIIAGAGLINELYKGYAPKGRFITASMIDQPPLNVMTYGADLTNNSYSSGGLCKNTSSDNLSSLIVDRQAIEFTSLIHVMAAGNSGNSQCSVFPSGYNTVYSGYQSAKSTLTVGATYTNGVLAGFSSKGPGRSGRLKPEIVAPGSNIIATTPYNSYGVNGGTSIACPAVVGGLGLLYQRYQQLHGSKPDNALMKPLLCNSATDLGPVGPDYGYGFGFMNLSRAIQVLDAGNFYKDSVTNQQSKTKIIAVPQGIAKLKVMLYWQDPPATPLTNKPLVNDLDITLTTPAGTTVLPFTLDTLPSLVTNPAGRAPDHINNVEQVVIDNPAAGNYTVSVNGYEIGEGDQQAFYVVYDLVPDAVQLMFPASGEVLASNDNISVQWDSWGDTSSTYTLEFSVDNGNDWQTISSTISSTSFDWTVPSTITNDARVRITRNSDGKTSSPGTFRIIGVPALRLSASQCPGSIGIEWPKVNGASDYEVMWYRNGDMTRVVITTDTSYLFRYLSEDSVYYVTVRSRNNGLPGRRAPALSVQPNTGDCKNPIQDHDLEPRGLRYPLTGRAFTLKRLGVETLTMQIRNLDDDAAAAGFSVAYSVNGKPWITETVNDGIASNGTLDYNFQTPFDFSAPGNYNVRLAVTNPGDVNHHNDTMSCVVRHIANAPVALHGGVSDNAMLTANRIYTSSYTGIDSLERFDYENAGGSQTVRVGNGIVFDGSQNPDAARPQSVIATYNLSLFDTAKSAAQLQFYYTQSSSTASDLDSLLIRGSDTAAWIFVQDFLPADSPWYVSKSFKIPLTDFLRSHAQDFSSSFQVRWTVSNYNSVVILSDVKLFDNTNDVGLTSIDSLQPYSCNLSKAVPIQVSLQNNTDSTIHNIPVKYRINKGDIVFETVPVLPPMASVSYRFNQTADLSSYASYNIEAWIENPQDAYSANDTFSFTLRNQPLITTFPFLENFEKSNGEWYASGTKSTWEYGTPSSSLITGAASGNDAWKTNLDGNYNASEFSQLYTGCYDLSKLVKPVISISIALNTDSCSPYCDGMGFQYCINGRDWRNMPLRSIYNWQQQFTSKWYNRWHVASERPVDSGAIIQFRFAFHSDSYNSFEGIGVDDFHLYDSTTTIYEGPSADVRQDVNSGQQWMQFNKDGKLLAAIQPQGQNLGTVQLQTFTHTGTIRNFHGQYYLNRNFVFKPGKLLSDSVAIRLYFTDKESDSLLFANNCTGCTLPKNAYLFGISYYKSSDSTELDSSILNNRKGEWNFIPNSKLKIVPFMNGYYAEFKVKDAGEFRFSNGGLDARSDLPLKLETFSVERLLSNVNLQWRTAAEINIDHFDVQVANGNEDFQSEQFEKIGQLPSKGRSASPQSYNFTDVSLPKTGTRYYRLKNVDVFGNFTYSNPLPVLFNEELTWHIFPNPGRGKYNLIYQSTPGDIVRLKVINSVGAIIKQLELEANGFVQTAEIDLSTSKIASGVYILQIQTQEKIHLLRVVKQ